MSHSENSAYFNSIDKSHLMLSGRVTRSYIEHGGTSGNRSTIEVGTMSPDRLMENMVDFSNIGTVSLDGVFCPYSTNVDHATLPTFVTQSSTSELGVLDLNPFVPNRMYKSGDSDAVKEQAYYESGHNIQVANSLTQVGSGVTEDMNFNKHLWGSSGIPTEINSVGMRLPMIGVGWGFTPGGLPIPADTGDNTKFHANAFNDPTLWPAGPIDFRWNASKGTWGIGGDSTTYLVKIVNVINPTCFSYEVERSNSRSQYTKPTLNGGIVSGVTIYDPESVAYDANSANGGCFERLDFDGVGYPAYEAFIVRDNSTAVGSANYYNIFADDCNDCGSINNPCGNQHGDSNVGLKILIENPLKQSFDVGDLAFTTSTGRSVSVNTGLFVGGSGDGAIVSLATDVNGDITPTIDAAGSGYTDGAFGIISSSGNICVTLTLVASGNDGITSVSVNPSGGYIPSQSYTVDVFPANATNQTESLGVHWVTQAEFKTSQVNTYVECDNGLLQSCSRILQTQGMQSCEWCGEDLTLSNQFVNL
jgi:hypothetical protein